jgi:phosphatidate cytidylyltransferase
VLRLRFLSAVIGVPVLLFVAVIGGLWYNAVVVVGAVLASLEVLGMLAGAGFHPIRPLGVVLAAAIVLDGVTTDSSLLPAILVVAAVGGLLLMMTRSDTDGALIDWGLTLGSSLYVGGTMHYFVALRALPDGLIWILTVLICSWVCDIAAFFVGRRWGRVRLAPRLSPGKSVEGAIGGLVGAVVVAVLLVPLLVRLMLGAGLSVVGQFGVPWLAVLGLVIGVCAIVGDLTESFVKRQCGAKDSGALIPGHGGVLDRIDSWLLAAVGAYFYVVTTS